MVEPATLQSQAHNLIQAQELECVKGYSTLFHAVNFSVSSSEILRIAGINGCGKTSLLRILSGISHPEKGQVKWNGQNIRSFRATYQGNMVYLGHQAGLKRELTATENMHYGLQLQACQPTVSISDVFDQFDIAHIAHLPCYHLSAGQQQRVALARIVASGAVLWILDEPGTALDQPGLSLLRHCLIAHTEAGGMVIFTSHHDFQLTGSRYKTLSLDTPA